MVLEETSQAEVWGIWWCSVGLVGKVLNPTEDKVPGTEPYSIDWQHQEVPHLPLHHEALALSPAAVIQHKF